MSSIYLIGMPYAIYRTYKSLKHKTEERRWATYWIIFSSIYLILSMIGSLVEAIPFLSQFISITVMAMQVNKDIVYCIYFKLLYPLLEKYESRIDPLVHELETHPTKTILLWLSFAKIYVTRLYLKQHVQESLCNIEPEIKKTSIIKKLKTPSNKILIKIRKRI